MSDIVQRLRAAAGERYSEGVNKGGTAGLLEDAAHEIDRLRNENDTAPPADVPQGWALVPVEPTHDMCLSGNSLLPSHVIGSDVVYRAMLSAAPQPSNEGKA
jgi:hypothetical protein